jgi:hypothetical protein
MGGNLTFMNCFRRESILKKEKFNKSIMSYPLNVDRINKCLDNEENHDKASNTRLVKYPNGIRLHV